MEGGGEPALPPIWAGMGEDDFKKARAARLRAALKEQDSTARDLMYALGIETSGGLTYKWVRGDSWPCTDKFLKMCAVLKKPPSFFYE